MKVRREDHWKPQSPVREGGVVYMCLDLIRSLAPPTSPFLGKYLSAVAPPNTC